MQKRGYSRNTAPVVILSPIFYKVRVGELQSYSPGCKPYKLQASMSDAMELRYNRIVRQI